MFLRVAVLLAALGGAACVSTDNTTPTGPSPRGAGGKRVRDIQLSPLRGEAGKPFSATLTWSDNYITEPELRCNGVPDGLAFDPATRTLSGKPKRPGFYTVQVAIRDKIKVTPAHKAKIEEGWWTAEFELEIFAPLKP